MLRVSEKHKELKNIYMHKGIIQFEHNEAMFRLYNEACFLCVTT